MISYRTLLQVDLSHDYFLSRGNVVFEAQSAADQSSLTALYSVADFLEIFPDSQTSARLAGQKMIFRANAGGFVVAVQIDPTAAAALPLVPSGTDLVLRFALKMKDARFANYTELGPGTPGFYRFGNDSQNEVAGICFLTRRVAAFDASRAYTAGETYSQASGTTFNLFVAIRDTGPAAAPVAADWLRVPADTWSASTTYQAGSIVLSNNQLFKALVNGPGTDLTNTTQWQPVGTLGNQYATAGDAIAAVSGLFDLDLSSAALAAATVRMFAASATTPAVDQAFVAPQGNLGQVQVDLRGLAPGLYRVQVLDGTLTPVAAGPSSVYVSSEATVQGWLGVVEIGVGSGDFALFNADGTLRAPQYVLRFLNRATFWRYIFPAVQAVGSGATVAPEGTDGRNLVSTAVRPLTRFGAGALLQADDPATTTVSEEVPLPAPDINLVRRQNAQWYSEINVPNITLGP